jgi:hypothetical protein
LAQSDALNTVGGLQQGSLVLFIYSESSLSLDFGLSQSSQL